MRVAVVGAGSIGKRHIGNLLSRGVAPGEVTVVDPRADRRSESEARFPGVVTAADISAMGDAAFDIALITSPTSMHVAQARAFAERGTTVLIEKPLDAGLEGADALAALVDKTGAKVLVAYPFRFSAPAQKLKALVNEGAIGRPLYVRGEFSEYLPDWHPWEDYRSFYMAKVSQGGGSLLDQSHVMDLAHWLFGDVKSVFAFSGRVSDLEVETDDLAELQVRFKSGLVGTIHQDMFGRQHRKEIDIKGTEGNLQWNAYDFSVTHYDRASRETRRFEFTPDHQLMYLAVTEHLLAIHAGTEAPLCTLAEGIHGMRIIEAARRSMVQGALVEVG